jgi:hypothetical protein
MSQCVGSGVVQVSTFFTGSLQLNYTTLVWNFMPSFCNFSFFNTWGWPDFENLPKNDSIICKTNFVALWFQRNIKGSKKNENWKIEWDSSSLQKYNLICGSHHIHTENVTRLNTIYTWDNHAFKQKPTLVCLWGSGFSIYLEGTDWWG